MSTSTSTPSFVSQELTNILSEFEYGIKPNSIKISQTTAKNSIFQLCLLENIQLTISITDIGFIITDASPYPTANEVNNIDLETVNKWVNHPFETMEALLLTTSPKFGEIFHQILFNKLLDLQSHQQDVEN
ncbi:27230_t:CDS:2 [Dentiscutata erythropus]|uniref:27230_t:CDS:1 n=1 Tax=Dentiscutata erythropus TaxID=1348616 RepID=A0A9N9J0S5_9GLOM|nr:27230_t:CDS:2 [Dentiscutata erythropus]